jgi:hypothetical protein
VHLSIILVINQLNAQICALCWLIAKITKKIFHILMKDEASCIYGTLKVTNYSVRLYASTPMCYMKRGLFAIQNTSSL